MNFKCQYVHLKFKIQIAGKVLYNTNLNTKLVLQNILLWTQTIANAMHSNSSSVPYVTSISSYSASGTFIYKVHVHFVKIMLNWWTGFFLFYDYFRPCILYPYSGGSVSVSMNQLSLIISLEKEISISRDFLVKERLNKKCVLMTIL